MKTMMKRKVRICEWHLGVSTFCGTFALEKVGKKNILIIYATQRVGEQSEPIPAKNLIASMIKLIIKTLDIR